MKLIACILALASCATVFAQSSEQRNFVIDSSKPYVYLKFDHIGPRKPIREGESSTGIWLRVVNNCRIPIVFLGFDGSTGEPGVVLLDEVVENEPMFEISASPNPDIDVQLEPQSQLPSPNPKTQQNTKQMPIGYSSELPGVYRILPGKELLFSFPLNHISDRWYMRVKFSLDLDGSSNPSGPYTYLPFHKSDIPKKFRPVEQPRLR